MPRFDGPEHLTYEGPIRALLETTFNALEGRVSAADACYERITRSEAWRTQDGARGVVPCAVKSGLVVRLVGDEGRILETSLGDLSPIEARMRLDESLAVLAVQPPGDAKLAPLPQRERRHFGPSAELPEATVLAARWQALFEAIETTLAAGAPSGATLLWKARGYVQVEEKVVADEAGLWRTQTLPQVFLRVELQALREPSRARYVMSFGRLGLLDAVVTKDGALSPDLAADLRDALTRVASLLTARALTPEEKRRLTHYVLAPSAMVFIHEACGHGFEADIIQQGGSGLFEADGSPVDANLGSPAVRLVDAPVVGGLKELFGAQLIDDEGNEVEPVVLLDHGRVSHVMHSRETAGRAGVLSNGRGFSELGEPRLVRMTNTCLVPAEPSFLTQDLGLFLRGVQLGVWLEGSFGGTVSGDGMSTTIQSARLIRDGALTDEWLLPCTLSVQTRGALKTVEGFHGEPTFPGAGFCGKGQIKTVTTGGCAARLAVTDAIQLAW